MPIFRWIIICLAVWLVIVILRQMIQRRRQNISNSNSKTAPLYSDVVACYHCNLHIPKTEALQKDGRYFCSNECLAKHEDAGNNQD